LHPSSSPSTPALSCCGNKLIQMSHLIHAWMGWYSNPIRTVMTCTRSRAAPEWIRISCTMSPFRQSSWQNISLLTIITCKEYIRSGELDLAALFIAEDVSDKVRTLMPEVELFAGKHFGWHNKQNRIKWSTVTHLRNARALLFVTLNCLIFRSMIFHTWQGLRSFSYWKWVFSQQRISRHPLIWTQNNVWSSTGQEQERNILTTRQLTVSLNK